MTYLKQFIINDQDMFKLYINYFYFSLQYYSVYNILLHSSVSVNDNLSTGKELTILNISKCINPN